MVHEVAPKGAHVAVSLTCGPVRLWSNTHRRFDRWLEEVAKAVGGSYCRLQMPLKLAVAVRETVAGHRLGALGGGGGVPMHPWGGKGTSL